jgi:hypothetical protein
MTPLERLIVLLEAEWHRLARLGQLSPALVDAAVDFLQDYTDRRQCGTGFQPVSHGQDGRVTSAGSSFQPFPWPPGPEEADALAGPVLEQACAYALFRVLLGAQDHKAWRGEPAADAMETTL